MRLFWGAFDNFLVPHTHAFDPAKWKSKGLWTAKTKIDKAVTEEVEFYQNTCLTCGDIIERKFVRNGTTNKS